MRVNSARGPINRPTGPPRRVLPYAAAALAGVGMLAAVAWGAVYACGRVASLPCFAVTDLRIAGLKHVRAGDFVGYIGDPRGGSVFRVDLGGMRKRASSHPWIKAASVKRELPSSVRVEVVEREPAALVETASGRFIIDEDGFAMTRVTNADWDFMPVIGYPKAQVSMLAEARTMGELKTAVELLRMARKDPTETLTGARVLVGDDGCPYLLVEGAVVKVGRGGYADKLCRLLDVARDIRKREARPTMIDLRFPGKVVVKCAPA